jgi:hypothetical protein
MKQHQIRVIALVLVAMLVLGTAATLLGEAL